MSHTWIEAEPANVDKGYCLRYKIRFDWMPSQGEPWWEGGKVAEEIPRPKQVVKRYAPGHHLLTRPGTGLPPAWKDQGVKCPSCKATSRQVFAEGWICLQPKCKQFWLLPKDGQLWPIATQMLSYAETYLRPATSNYEQVPFSVVPPAPTGEGRAQWRGWVCTCGRANCRYRWELWVSVSS